MSARLGLLLVLAASPAWAAALPPCPPQSDLAADSGSLPHLAAALKPGGTIDLLAVGSNMPPPIAAIPAPAHLSPGKAGVPAGAVSAPAAESPGLPWQTARALEAQVRGLRVNVVAIGHRGMTAWDMLPALRSALAAKPYTLVMWLTGTVDAVDSTPPDDFYEALAEGAAAAVDSGADLILVGPQYSRFLEENANLQPYDAALRATGALPGVALFPRFDLMKDWASQGSFDLERTAKADRPAMAAQLQACLGRELAHMVVQDAAADGP